MRLSSHSSLRSRRIKGRGYGRRKREGNACYKSRFFCISAYCLTVIGLTKLSVQWPIRIRRTVFCMTDFTREGEWKNIHNAASSVRKSSSCVMSATPKKTKDRHSKKQQLQILWRKRYFWRRKSIIWKILAIGQRRKCQADLSWVLRLDWVFH